MRKYYELASYVYRKTLENKGITINLENHEPIDGYMLGTPGNELKVKIDAFTPEIVEDYIKSKLSRLFFNYCYIGTWILNDEVYLDVSHKFMNREIALHVGRLYHQLCIWNVAEKKEIPC
jgi:hypothetical protein